MTVFKKIIRLSKHLSVHLACLVGNVNLPTIFLDRGGYVFIHWILNHINRASSCAIDLIPLDSWGSIIWKILVDSLFTKETKKFGFHTFSFVLELQNCRAKSPRHSKDKRPCSWNDTFTGFLCMWKYIRISNLTVLFILQQQLILYQ